MSNLRLSSRWGYAKIKTNANTLIQEIINIAEMLTDADIALYRILDCDSAQRHGKPENNIHDMNTVLIIWAAAMYGFVV